MVVQFRVEFAPVVRRAVARVNGDEGNVLASRADVRVWLQKVIDEAESDLVSEFYQGEK